MLRPQKSKFELSRSLMGYGVWYRHITSTGSKSPLSNGVEAALLMPFNPIKHLVCAPCASQSGHPRHYVERELIGISHAEIGQEIASLWDLPPEISESIAHHHAPSYAMRHKMLAAQVYITDVAVRRMGIGDSGNPALPAFQDEFAQSFQLPTSMDELLEKEAELREQIDAIGSS